MTETHEAKAGSTSYSSGDKAIAPRSTQVVAIPSRSSHTASLGVHVTGLMHIKRGNSTALSLSMDPATLERKLAVEQVRMELQGETSTPTTSSRR